MRTLVAFLGRTERVEGRYPEVNYRFPDGMERRTAFFGLALAENLEPDRVVILGTRGSMWDALVEHVAGDSLDETEARLELMQNAPAECVTQDLLSRCEALISRGVGRTVLLRLIPYGEDATQQQEILAVIAEAVLEGEVRFDVTHGFRHLAALGLLSSFFLRGADRLDVAGIYYGAFDMAEEDPDNPDEQVAPVIRLDGVLAIQAWIEALAKFDSSGDYSVFAPLLRMDGMPKDKAACLSLAAFYERASNVKKAREQIRTFIPALREIRTGPSALFKFRLEERLAWTHKSSLFQNQIELAHIYREREDILRATMFGLEAVITRECRSRNYDEDNYENSDADTYGGGRKDAKDNLNRDGPEPYKILDDLRNSLAHGTIPRRRKVVEILENAEGWTKKIDALFEALNLVTPPVGTSPVP